MDRGYVLDERYRLLDRLGQGGMSVVWRAHDDLLGRDVAVKLLSPYLAVDAQVVHRIHLEARAAAGLRHPHIVEVYDYGQDRDGDGRPVPYVVMELVDGRSFEQLLSGGGLPWRVAVMICAQVAAALAAAHARGVVHRDIKPANVMVTGEGVKLVDFGISAVAGEVEGQDDELLGTPAYLAPERLDGGPVRAATDVYALGLLLYRSLTGRLPWRAATTTQMLIAHRYEEPAALPSITDLPAEVAALCGRCLVKDPGSRPAAAEVADVLGRIAGLTPPLRLVPADPDPEPADAAGPATATYVLSDKRPGNVSSAAGTRRHPVTRRRVLVPLIVAAALVPAAGLGIARMGPDPEETSALPAGPAAAAPATGNPEPSCTVRYALRALGDGHFSAAISLANTGTTTMRAWQLTFAFPAEQRITRGWTGRWQQDGRSVQAHGGTLGPGGSTSTGFDATYRSAAGLPDLFRLNGTVCQADLSVAGPAPANPQPARITVDSPPKNTAEGQPGRDTAGKAKGTGKSAKKSKPGKGTGKGKKD